AANSIGVKAERNVQDFHWLNTGLRNRGRPDKSLTLLVQTTSDDGRPQTPYDGWIQEPRRLVKNSVYIAPAGIAIHMSAKVLVGERQILSGEDTAPCMSLRQFHLHFRLRGFIHTIQQPENRSFFGAVQKRAGVHISRMDSVIRDDPIQEI